MDEKELKKMLSRTKVPKIVMLISLIIFGGVLYFRLNMVIYHIPKSLETPLGVGIVLLGGVSFIAFLLVMQRWSGLRSSLKRIEKKEGLANLCSQVKQLDNKSYEKVRVTLTRDYMLALNTGAIVKMEDIVWMYPESRTSNGITETNIIVRTRDKKAFNLFDYGLLKKDADTIIPDIIDSIIQKCPGIMIGDSPENKKIYKEYIKK